MKECQVSAINETHSVSKSNGPLPKIPMKRKPDLQRGTGIGKPVADDEKRAVLSIKMKIDEKNQKISAHDEFSDQKKRRGSNICKR